MFVEFACCNGDRVGRNPVGQIAGSEWNLFGECRGIFLEYFSVRVMSNLKGLLNSAHSTCSGAIKTIPVSYSSPKAHLLQ